MIQYVYNRIIVIFRDIIGNIFVYACIFAMLTICFQIGSKLVMIVDAEWLEQRLQVVAITDIFIRRKLKAITVFVLAIISIIYIFGLVLLGMKTKLEIMTERSRLSMFKILGYSDLQICMPMYVGKVCELLISSAIGILISFLGWKLLCNQTVFMDFVKIFDDNIDFELIWNVISLLIVMLLLFPIEYLVISKNVRLMDVKGEE